MKIALLSFEYPSETGFGGIGTYTWYHARALAKLGHDVHVLAGATSPTALRTETHDNVQVHRFQAEGLFMRGGDWLGQRGLWWTKSRWQTGWSMHRGLNALRRLNRYDVIEMPECGGEGWMLNHLTRLPAVVRFHSPARLIMEFYDVRRADILSCSALERLGMLGASAFSSCSRFLADEVKTRLGVRAPVRVIPNGIDLELFDRDESESIDVRRRFDLPAGRPVILFTGRMERRKGIQLCTEIVSAVLANREAAFVFAGRDLFGYLANTLLPALQGRTLRGSVHYLGSLTLPEIRSCVRQADIFLLPSLWENCPYSCLEAMAASRAIVCSDQGGMPELIRDGVTGLLARSGSAASYVQQIERLLDDDRLRARLGAAARQSVEASFSDVHVARVAVDQYRGLAAARS
jgi:glycosyltransferase involved in cell wall biosynthesis